MSICYISFCIIFLSGEFQEMSATSFESHTHPCLSSPKLNQPPQPPGMNPVLMEYKQYLISYYKARALAQADKYLPTPTVPFINLAIVSRESFDVDERDEFTRQTLHGGIDQILRKKSPIAIEDLMTTEGSGEPVKFILVEGPPGIGKSTFAWEMCRRWDDLEALKPFQTVVLLRLREKWVLSATSLYEIFRYEHNPELSKSISKELAKTQGRHLLLVLDGFDEISHSFHVNSIIKSILCKQILPECTIILTTRPSAMHNLKTICQPHVDKHIEIIGFTEEDRVKYITKAFSKKPELQIKFFNFVFNTPSVKSLVYSPLNCAIIAQVYSEFHSSCQNFTPKTITQLLKALSHSLLYRHICTENSRYEYTSMLPENLMNKDMDNFKNLAKFAFDTYHDFQNRKITFFKEDIPEGFVHFGFMNESAEMYASRGFEQVFSFLHLSLQEYLAAWHIANGYSIDFQIAYHKLVADVYDVELQAPSLPLGRHPTEYHCANEAEEALRINLELSLQLFGNYFLQPAIFLAGITGWNYTSNEVHKWEEYLTHHSLYLHPNALLPFLFEAQNPNIFKKYFSAQPLFFSRCEVEIDSHLSQYDCYGLSYCLAHCENEELELNICIRDSAVVDLLKVFVKGFEDHLGFITPKIYKLTIRNMTDSGMMVSGHTVTCPSSGCTDEDSVIPSVDSLETFKNCMFWLKHATFINGIHEITFLSQDLKLDCVQDFVASLIHLQVLKVSFETLTSWEWLNALKSLSNLMLLDISFNTFVRSVTQVLTGAKPPATPFPPADLLCWPLEHGLQGFLLNVKFPTSTIYTVESPADQLLKSVLKSAQMSSDITALQLPDVSRATMSGVHKILLHCPNLQHLELNKTRLGFDGICFICSALRKNKVLKVLTINDIHNTKVLVGSPGFASFTTMEKYYFPTRMTCTDFILELNSILKDNASLETISIQSDFFFPLTESGWFEWTGLGPLQQFNAGAIASDRPTCLRRSLSLSDLTQPKTRIVWRNMLIGADYNPNIQVDFTQYFFVKQKKGEKLFSLPSLTAPDCDLLQSFSSLDHRLKDTLKISELDQYVETLQCTYQGMLQSLLYQSLRLNPTLPLF